LRFLPKKKKKDSVLFPGFEKWGILGGGTNHWSSNLSRFKNLQSRIFKKAGLTRFVQSFFSFLNQSSGQYASLPPRNALQAFFWDITLKKTKKNPNWWGQAAGGGGGA